MLAPASETKLIRVRNGEVRISDCLAMEAERQITGFNILECSGMAEALEVASKHPVAGGLHACSVTLAAAASSTETNAPARTRARRRTPVGVSEERSLHSTWCGTWCG